MQLNNPPSILPTVEVLYKHFDSFSKLKLKTEKDHWELKFGSEL